MKVPRRYRRKWRKPWRVKLSKRRNRGFKRWLWRHGYLSPNFRRIEAGSKAGARCPAAGVPSTLKHGAQEHAFRLERVRHKLGDRSMSALSWYRSPCHNSEVGGATGSKHMEATATDWSDGTRASLGGERFDRAMEDVFSSGGIGTVASNGHVRHVDNGPKRRWWY